MKDIKMILTNRYDPDIRVHKEAKYLVSKGFNVEVLCWDRENDYKKEEIVDGVKIRRFYPYAKYGTGIKQVISFFKFISEINHYLKINSYDYLHCHDLDGIITGYLANSKQRKLIFDMHEIYEINGNRQRNKFLIRLLVKFLQSKSEKIIYLNKLQTLKLSEKSKSKLVYLPNYPETNNFFNAEKVKSMKLRISYIGAVRQFKELKMIMDASVGINDIDIKIHGAGVAYKKLKDIESNYYNVTVTGKYNYLDSIKLYNHTDILYAIYSNENLQYKGSYPVKLFEAIITKTPIIVNKNSVLADFVEKHGIGFVVNGNDVDAIRELIMYINKNDDVLQKKANNLEKIQHKFSWETVVSNLDSVYY